MLRFADALRLTLENVPSPTPVIVPLQEAVGRILAENIAADRDLPPFNKAFMDGYAFRSEDAQRSQNLLRVVGTIAAGAAILPKIGPGQAAQIMTGAPMPPGADSVQMVEKTERRGDEVVIEGPVALGLHVAPQGNEVKAGQVVLKTGSRLDPCAIGVLATFGRRKVSVYSVPSVSILATGDELVELEEQPTPHQIRNSNAHMLRALCQRLGVEVTLLPAVGDDPEMIGKAVKEGLRYSILVLTGGVSMGIFDQVHDVLTTLGIEIIFHRVAIRPGKPLLLGRRGDRMVFGLPGNPVSSLVTFELFVKPAIQKWMVQSPPVQWQWGVLEREVTQKAGRLFFMPAVVNWSEAGARVRPLETKGSADLAGFSGANALALFPADQTFLAGGELVQFLLLTR